MTITLIVLIVTLIAIEVYRLKKKRILVEDEIEHFHEEYETSFKESELYNLQLELSSFINDNEQVLRQEEVNDMEKLLSKIQKKLNKTRKPKTIHEKSNKKDAGTSGQNVRYGEIIPLQS